MHILSVKLLPLLYSGSEWSSNQLQLIFWHFLIWLMISHSRNPWCDSLPSVRSALLSARTWAHEKHPTTRWRGVLCTVYIFIVALKQDEMAQKKTKNKRLWDIKFHRGRHRLWLVDKDVSLQWTQDCRRYLDHIYYLVNRVLENSSFKWIKPVSFLLLFS